MPSYSQEIKVDLNSNEDVAYKNQSKENQNEEVKYVATDSGKNGAPPGLNADQRLAFALRDFLGPPNMVLTEDGPSPSNVEQKLPFIDELPDVDGLVQSDEEPVQNQETDEVLNNAACRLRRWRAASRKLRRPRIINNLSADDVCNGVVKTFNGGHTDLADRLRSLAAASNMSASAGELLSLAPPPPAATAPPSPSCLLTPSLADQSSAEYFVSCLCLFCTYLFYFTYWMF